MAEKKKNNNNNNDDDSKQCVIDKLICELELNGMKLIECNNIYSFFVSEDYDTDSIEEDLEIENESNIGDKIKSSKLFLKCLLLIKECKLTKQASSSLYSAGYRYFYWPFYKNNKNKFNILYTIDDIGYLEKEENVGYKLMDWYINKKYDNFKYELMNNKICQFTIDEFKNTKNKSILKLNEKKIRCNEYDDDPKLRYFERCYGIKSDSYFIL